MRISNRVLNCVCFLCHKSTDPAGEVTWVYRGTAFFVILGDHTDGESGRIHLVTARHVIERRTAPAGCG